MSDLINIAIISTRNCQTGIAVQMQLMRDYTESDGLVIHIYWWDSKLHTASHKDTQILEDTSTKRCD